VEAARLTAMGVRRGKEENQDSAPAFVRILFCPASSIRRKKKKEKIPKSRPVFHIWKSQKSPRVIDGTKSPFPISSKKEKNKMAALLAGFHRLGKKGKEAFTKESGHSVCRPWQQKEKKEEGGKLGFRLT